MGLTTRLGPYYVTAITFGRGGYRVVRRPNVADLVAARLLNEVALPRMIFEGPLKLSDADRYAQTLNELHIEDT